MLCAGSCLVDHRQNSESCDSIRSHIVCSLEPTEVITPVYCCPCVWKPSGWGEAGWGGGRVLTKECDEADLLITAAPKEPKTIHDFDCVLIACCFVDRTGKYALNGCNKIEGSQWSYGEHVTLRHLSFRTNSGGRHWPTPFPSFPATDDNDSPSSTQSSRRARSFSRLGLELRWRKEVGIPY